MRVNDCLSMLLNVVPSWSNFATKKKLWSPALSHSSNSVEVFVVEIIDDVNSVLARFVGRVVCFKDSKQIESTAVTSIAV